jgi:polyferredoxin
VLGRWLVLVMAGGIVAGYPLFLWMDPLALFNGFFSAWRRPWVGWNLLPAMGFVVVMAGSVMWPQAWCRRVCPLGGLQTMLGTLGQTVRRRLRGTRFRTSRLSGCPGGSGYRPGDASLGWAESDFAGASSRRRAGVRLSISLCALRQLFSGVSA